MSYTIQNPAGTIQTPPRHSPQREGGVSSLRDFEAQWLSFFRRLKPTVKNVNFLRSLCNLCEPYEKFLLHNCRSSEII
jgi:hypothetical protein